MMTKFASLIISFVIALHSAEVVQSTIQCCDDGVLIVTVRSEYQLIRQCGNGKDLGLNCSSHTNMLNNDWSEHSHFMVRNDKEGEYVDAFGFGYITRSPHFCVGNIKSEYSEQWEDVAITCYVNRIWYSDIDEKELPPAAPLSERWLPLLIQTLNIVSAVTLAVATLIYGLLRDLQDSQGVCTFHFVLNSCVLHTSVVYYTVANTNGLIPSTCVTNLYIILYLILCTFMWCVIMGYNSWIHVRHAQRIINEEAMLKRYRYIGYGLPLFVILISNIYAHALKLYNEFRFEMKCAAHQNGVLIVSVMLPVVTATLANIFFFIDMQRLLWNSPALELRSEKSTLRKLKYRLLLNGKLFVILGGPWLMFILWSWMNVFLELSMPFVTISRNIIILLISGEGIPIFLLLVFFRKRVLKGVSRAWLTRFSIFPVSWRNAVDSETVEDDVENAIDQENSTFVEPDDSEAKDKILSDA